MVATQPGGVRGGGAALTPFGRELIETRCQRGAGLARARGSQLRCDGA